MDVLQEELLELSKIGDPTQQMRGNIVASQWGDLVRHLTHDQTINPTVRPHGSKETEILAAGHFLVQSMTYVALRGININEAIVKALIAIRENEVLKVPEGSLGIVVSEGRCEGPAWVDPECLYLEDMPNGCILVTSHPTSGLVQWTHKLKGIITDHGGYTCHAAIVAREHNIPCVTGTGNATQRVLPGKQICITPSGWTYWGKP